MRVLLVEPATKSKRARRTSTPTKTADDEALLYPPLGLMKLASFHKRRGDEVRFVHGCDRELLSGVPLFSSGSLWDRVYITTLFTFDWDAVIKTIRFYRDVVGGVTGRVFVGGIMASLMADEIHEETGVFPITGVLHSPERLGFSDSVDIDLLPPDFSILDPNCYAVNDTYYAYTSRGCVNRCAWCGVPTIEPDFVPYIDIKPIIRTLRKEHGDKARLKLMDNNVLASPDLERIVDDLVVLGYGRGTYTETTSRRQRVIDFNQGVDASFLTEHTMRLLARLNVRPLRVAFDRAQEKEQYVRAMETAYRAGVTDFSTYMLFNFRDTPRDLYERLVTNIALNERWGKESNKTAPAQVYAYPMRYAPIHAMGAMKANRRRDPVERLPAEHHDLLKSVCWNPRLVRSLEVMKGAAHGAISPTPTLARRTIGATYQEFLANLFMPETLLRERNKHERRIYPGEPKRKRGSGKVEAFRDFILQHLKAPSASFIEFLGVISQNRRAPVREYLARCRDREFRTWLELYLGR